MNNDSVRCLMTEAQNFHVRQHYIPQFILKNFCHDPSRKKVFFFEVGKHEYSSEFVSNIFMEKRLYATAESQIEIEESLAKFEADIAPIFKKFGEDAEISLTFAENDRLRIFLSLLAFRSVNTREQFNNMSSISKTLYRGGSEETDMKDLWLTNVHLLSQCRSIKEVVSHPKINHIIKHFIRNEFCDFYMCLLDRRGDVDFHISDCYPIVMYGESELPNGKKINPPIYFFFPISESRMLALVTNHIKSVPKSVVHLDCDKILKGPKRSLDREHLLFRPEKIYSPDVEWINEMIIKNAKIGVVVKNPDRCSDSL